MEYIKELFEAFASRSRSHFFGSIMISFLGLNWQPVYFVINSDVDILERFAYFDYHMKLWQPLIIGFALAIITPALTWGGTWWAEKFTTRVKIIQAGAASSVAIKEMTFENDRAEAKAIIALTVDETLGKIEDEAVRDKFREDALSSTNNSDDVLEEKVNTMTETEKNILRSLYVSSDKDLYTIDLGGNDLEISIDGSHLDFERPRLGGLAIETLNRDALIEQLNLGNNLETHYRITPHGRKIAELLINVNR